MQEEKVSRRPCKSVIRWPQTPQMLIYFRDMAISRFPGWKIEMSSWFGQCVVITEKKHFPWFPGLLNGKDLPWPQSLVVIFFRFLFLYLSFPLHFTKIKQNETEKFHYFVRWRRHLITPTHASPLRMRGKPKGTMATSGYWNTAFICHEWFLLESFLFLQDIFVDNAFVTNNVYRRC